MNYTTPGIRVLWSVHVALSWITQTDKITTSTIAFIAPLTLEEKQFLD